MERSGIRLKLMRQQPGDDERFDVARLTATPVEQCENRSARVFAWIEFPERAAHAPELRELVQAACRSAKVCERYDGVIHLQDHVPHGRFRNLEAAFQSTDMPFDCGGEDAIDHLPWQGWWRPGSRRPVIYEVGVGGEQIVPLNDLRALLATANEGALMRSLAKLIEKHDHSAPTQLRAQI